MAIADRSMTHISITHNTLARRAPTELKEDEAAVKQYTYHSPAVAALLQLPPTTG
jgi:hypothetical protein